MSGDETAAEEQATGSLGPEATGQGTLHPELLRSMRRWHAATGHSAPAVTVCKEMDTAQGIRFGHPSPQRNNPLWHKHDGVEGRPGPEANQ